MPTSIYKPDLLDEALARIRRESIEDAEACDRAGPPTYSILERSAGDPDEEARLAAYHVERFLGTRRAYRCEVVPLMDLLSELEGQKAEVERRIAIARERYMQNTRHDRMALGAWLSDTKAAQGTRRSVEILGCTLGLVKFSEPAKVKATAEWLAKLFPDLTVPKLTDMRAAKARLRIEGKKVIVAATGEVVYDEEAPADGEVPQVWIAPAETGERRFIEVDKERLPLEIGKEVPDDAAPEGAEEASDNGE